MEGSQAIHGPGSWEPYLDELHSLYIDQGWPLKKLMQHMEHVRRINATTKQYKSLFTRLGWKKNATGSEWAALGAVIAKRKREGKDTDVFVDGKLVDAKRLKRELSRYQTTAEDGLVDPPELSGARFRVGTPLGHSRPIDITMDNQDIAPETCHILAEGQQPCFMADGFPASADRSTGSCTMDTTPIGSSAFPFFQAESPSQSVGSPVSVSFSLINFSPDPWPDQSYTPPDELYDQPWKDQMSPPDLSRLSDLNRMIWTRGLCFYTMLESLSELECCDIIVYNNEELKTQTIPRPPLLSPAWSVDGLRLLATEVSSLASGAFSMKICHPVLHIESASVFELLDLVVCSVICRPAAEDIAVGRFHELLMEWSVDPRHLPVLERLMRKKKSNFKIFARNWIEVAVRVVCSNSLPSSEPLSGAKARILSAVKHLHTSVIDSDISLPEYLMTMAAAYGHVGICNMLLHRGVSIHGADGTSRNPLSSAIHSHEVATINFLLDQGANVWDTRRKYPWQCNRTGGCAWNLQAQMLLSWRDHHRGRDPSQLLLVLARRSDPASGLASISTPCWEEFSALDICALVGQPLSVDPIFYSPYPKPPAESPVTRIARAAFCSEEQLRALQADQAEPVSSYDLEMALLGAAALRSGIVVRRLLAVGTHPDCPTLRSSQASYRRVHVHPTGYFGPSTHEHPTRNWNRRSGLKPCILFETPLEVAGRTRGGGDIVALLLDAGATMTYRFIDSLSSPYFSITNKLAKQAVLARLSQPGVLRCHGSSLMHAAICWGDLEMVDFLISQGVSINSVMSRWGSQLDTLPIAITNRDVAFVKELWERGARFSGLGGGGWELILACSAGVDCEAKTQFLLEKGASPNFITIDMGTSTTPLLQVIRQRRPETQLTALMRTLIRAGADPNLGVGSQTPLREACTIGHGRAVQLLLKHGTQIRDSNSLTWPITPDCTGSAADIIVLLIRECQNRGIDVGPGATKALGLAAKNGFIDIAIKLLDAGADVNGFVGRADTEFGGLDNVCCCCDGDATPIEVAAWGGWIDMVKLLINAGAEGDDAPSPTTSRLRHVSAMPFPVASASIDDPADMLPTRTEQSPSPSLREEPRRFRRAIRFAKTKGHIHVVDLLRAHQ